MPNSICGIFTCDTNIAKFANIIVSVNTIIHDTNNRLIADAIILDNDLGDIITGLTADFIIMDNTIGNNDYSGKMGLAQRQFDMVLAISVSREVDPDI